MGAKPEPAPEPQPPAEPVAEPAADDKSEPEPTTRHELEVATRSARSALITAVAAAVISSFVAAGSAVYVSINQSNRSESLAVAQAVRQDRQKVYSDFSVALFGFTQQLGNMVGVLQARGSIDSARPQITELSRQQGEFLAGLNLLLMAGSSGMQQVGIQFSEVVGAFSRDHLGPFTAQYTVDAPRDAARWEQESTAFVAAINDLISKIGDLNGAFVEQGVKDLQ
ncbi:MAG TPA: hypothetical protein VL634_07400 [Mycobacterium sp.]|nr:hypothetical protein [Mycobacterium sp.]